MTWRTLHASLNFAPLYHEQGVRINYPRKNRWYQFSKSQISLLTYRTYDRMSQHFRIVRMTFDFFPPDSKTSLHFQTDFRIWSDFANNHSTAFPLSLTSRYSAMCSHASSSWFSSRMTSNISGGHWANFSAATNWTFIFRDWAWNFF